MAEYIDREKLIERLHNAEENYKADHDYEVDDDPFSDGILSAMFSVNQIVGTEPTADVIERSKIDKAIEEIKQDIIAHSGTGEEVIQAYCDGLKKALEYFENIGE